MEQAIVIIFEITSLPFITFYLTSSLSSRNWYYRFWRSVRNLYLPVIIETLFSYRFLLALYHFLIAFLLILPCSSSSESISTFSGFSLFFFAGIRRFMQTSDVVLGLNSRSNLLFLIYFFMKSKVLYLLKFL